MYSELDSGDKELLRRALERLAGANENIRFLSDWFRDKYQLTPAHQITPTGQIVRVEEGSVGEVKIQNRPQP